MKTRIIAAFLTTIFLIQPAHNAGVFIRFKINQDFYARVLCINKEKPELKCHGKCQLKKQLKAAEQKSNEKKNPAIETTNLFLLFRPLARLKLEVFPETRERSSVFLINNYPFICLVAVFHPPRIS